MTEDEAKTKWCPFSGNRVCNFTKDGEWRKFVQDNGLDGKCIGLKCMAWRVLEQAIPAQNEVKFVEWWDGEEKPQTPTEEDGWMLTDKGQDDPDERDDKSYLWEKYSREKKAATPETGYCGLAGKL